jgi:Na+/melibiose symporter-like transporter
VGFLSDKIECKWGKRNSWYYFGSILVAPAFLCIFGGFSFFATEHGENAWYITFPAIFNVGWAAVQISHLSIVNQLSYSQRMRDLLVNNRNGFTYVANIFVLGFSLFLFYFIPNPIQQFRILSICCVALGACTTIFYVSVIKENWLKAEALKYEKEYQKVLGNDDFLSNSQNGSGKKGKTPKDWLGETQFYIFGLVYMFVRLALNMTATFTPFYLTTVCGFVSDEGTSVAIAAEPLVSYSFSLILSVYF